MKRSLLIQKQNYSFPGTIKILISEIEINICTDCDHYENIFTIINQNAERKPLKVYVVKINRDNKYLS